MQQVAVGSRAGRGRVVIVLVCLLIGALAGTAIGLILRPTATSVPRSEANASIGSALLARTNAPSFTLTDQDGNALSLTGLHGRLVLLTFMDPRCTLLCPLMGRDIAAMEQRLPAGVNPVLLVVSVAPGRTKADVQDFVTKLGTQWRPGWHWLLGPDQTALKQAWISWHVTVAATAGDVVHDEILNVIDPDGYLRVSYPAPLQLDDVVTSIKKIVHA